MGVAELLAAHGGNSTAASCHRSLGNLVDAMAERGIAHIDDALRVLRDLQREVRGRGCAAGEAERESLCCAEVCNVVPATNAFDVIDRGELQAVLAACDSEALSLGFAAQSSTAVMRGGAWRQLQAVSAGLAGHSKAHSVIPGHETDLSARNYGPMWLRHGVWHAQGQPVAIQMLNCIIAAFSQVGNLARAFETFEAASGMNLTPDTDSYNALMEGLVDHGQAAALPRVRLTQSLHVLPIHGQHEMLPRSMTLSCSCACEVAHLHPVGRPLLRCTRFGSSTKLSSRPLVPACAAAAGVGGPDPYSPYIRAAHAQLHCAP